MDGETRPYIEKGIVRVEGNSRTQNDDIVAVESRLTVFINNRELLTLHCTPLMLPELLNGLLLTEGILSDCVPEVVVEAEDDGNFISKISAPEVALNRDFSVSRDIGGFAVGRRKDLQIIGDPFSLRLEDLKRIFSRFSQRSELFRLTGCFHSAALSDGINVLSFAEDIGRHNAIDKVIGHAIINNIPFGGKIMLVSCRVSSEIISKCALWRIPVLASRSAPTDLAIRIAEKSGMTLVGFARGERFNIYTNPERILFERP